VVRIPASFHDGATLSVTDENPTLGKERSDNVGASSGWGTGKKCRFLIARLLGMTVDCVEGGERKSKQVENG
jgi:hypothetical protein